MSTITPDITRKIYTVVVASGSGSQALPTGMANEIVQILVIPPVQTTTYHVYIRDGLDGVEVFRREDDLLGTYNEILTPCLPVFGNNTFHISNASADGNFKLRVVYK